MKIVKQLNLLNLVPGRPVTGGIPSVTLAPYSAFGDNSDGPYQNQNNTAQFTDSVSWNKGKHSFKFGFEYDRQNFNQLGNQPVRITVLASGEYVSELAPRRFKALAGQSRCRSKVPSVTRRAPYRPEFAEGLRAVVL